ncbi:aldo/keto reductase [Cytophaga sp. FL35]|uniref:aldo/keto reductase n=1 Tax=Cytophaga sp. FL35 TaxID=1904456 RepID=UPI001653AA22|nr:aldo/keto reductase [Cytophaga sp. FL35]MBC7000399.1 aldo/keto reductase [Cytophaga sp. FL35]
MDITKDHKIESYTLNDGKTIPYMGFGTYQATEEEGIESVKFALQNGYRLLDTAARYENEEAVGKGIIQSGIPREEIMVTTKVWRDRLGYDETKKAFFESLERLQLDYIDLYLIHWPANEKNFGADWQKINSETWRAMEDLQMEGKIKSLGLSNFWPEHLEPLLQTARIKPAVNQIEFHPGYWQPGVFAYCKERDVRVEAWSPFAKGAVFKNGIMKEIAKKYNKTVAQITLQWIVQHGAVPIPKSTTKERVLENIDIYNFELTGEDLHTISQLPKMGFSGELPNEWPDIIGKQA